MAEEEHYLKPKNNAIVMIFTKLDLQISLFPSQRRSLYDLYKPASRFNHFWLQLIRVKFTIFNSREFQLPAEVRAFGLVVMATEDANFKTRTASLLTALEAATSSKRFQVDSRLSCVSLSLTSSS